MKSERVPFDLLQFAVVRTLHRMTAKAMGVPFRPGRPALQAYAAFTREQLEKLPGAEVPAVQERMYRIAYRMGTLCRKVLCIRSDARARRLVFLLYRMIGIELAGVCPGQITVRRCFFRDFYTPEMCRVMSAMDRGIFAGVFGGGELTFTERITEGCACCHADFSTDETRTEQ